MVDFSKTLFRCSSLGDLLTDSKNAITEIQLAKIDELVEKKTGKGLTPKQAEELERLITKRDTPELSKTCKTKLVEIYVNVVDKRYKDVQTRQMKKGLMTEQNCITTVSRVTKKFLRKNTERLFNDYIIGEPDIFEGPDVRHATKVTDTKSCWDLFTFRGVLIEPVDSGYAYQLNGYGELTGADDLCLAYCLENMPEPMVKEEVWRLYRKMGEPDSESDVWKQAEKELRASFIYDDLPVENRLLMFEFQRDPLVMATIKDRATLWREYLAHLYKRFNPLKLAES